MKGSIFAWLDSSLIDFIEFLGCSILVILTLRVNILHDFLIFLYSFFFFFFFFSWVTFYILQCSSFDYFHVCLYSTQFSQCAPFIYFYFRLLFILFYGVPVWLFANCIFLLLTFFIARLVSCLLAVICLTFLSTLNWTFTIKVEDYYN